MSGNYCHTNFEHFFGILSPHKILSKSALCLDLLLSVTPLSLFFCPTPLLWVAWQIEWDDGGGVEKFFDSDWYHRLFLQYIKQKHRDSGSLAIFRVESFGDQRETGIMTKFLGILLVSPVVIWTYRTSIIVIRSIYGVSLE